MTIDQIEMFHFLAQEHRVADIEYSGKSVARELAPMLAGIMGVRLVR